jgi:hypothetical protein
VLDRKQIRSIDDLHDLNARSVDVL